MIFKEKLEKYHDFIKSKLAGSEERWYLLLQADNES
jgi:hypothetical protein